MKFIKFKDMYGEYCINMECIEEVNWHKGTRLFVSTKRDEKIFYYETAEEAKQTYREIMRELDNDI
jgi:ATP:corrinoid adenosyltransferase